MNNKIKAIWEKENLIIKICLQLKDKQSENNDNNK